MREKGEEEEGGRRKHTREGFHASLCIRVCGTITMRCPSCTSSINSALQSFFSSGNVSPFWIVLYSIGDWDCKQHRERREEKEKLNPIQSNPKQKVQNESKSIQYILQAGGGRTECMRSRLHLQDCPLATAVSETQSNTPSVSHWIALYWDGMELNGIGIWIAETH